MKIGRFVKTSGIADLFAASSAYAAPANLILNGDFELTNNTTFSSNFATINAGSTHLDNWVVGGTSIDVINGAYGAVSGNSIDILGTPGPGSIAQSFAYSANTAYVLAFDLSSNGNGGSPATDVTVSFFGANTTVTGTGTVQHLTYTFGGSGTGGLSTLQFGSLYGGNSGAVIDNVSVTAAVPEPETYAMLLAGLGLLGLMRRKSTHAR